MWACRDAKRMPMFSCSKFITRLPHTHTQAGLWTIMITEESNTRAEHKKHSFDAWLKTSFSLGSQTTCSAHQALCCTEGHLLGRAPLVPVSSFRYKAIPSVRSGTAGNSHRKWRCTASTALGYLFGQIFLSLSLSLWESPSRDSSSYFRDDVWALEENCRSVMQLVEATGRDQLSPLAPSPQNPLLLQTKSQKGDPIS